MSGLVPWARGHGALAQSPSSLVPYQQGGNLAPAPIVAPSLREWWRELRGEVSVEPPSPVQSAVIGLRQNAEGVAAVPLIGRVRPFIML